MNSAFNNLTKDEFYQLLEDRLREYRTAILGNRGDHGMTMLILQAAIQNVLKIKSIDREIDLLGSDFWGYGINSVCDGIETHFQHDVEVVKTINELNKHQSEYRLLWLLTFKVYSNSLYVSTFCIDSCGFKVNANNHTKYNLSDIVNARLRTREERIYVDFIFTGLKNPIHFQIDPNVYKVGKSKEQLAQYYISKINELAEDVKYKTGTISNSDKNIDDLNKLIDKIETGLRNLIVTALIKETGQSDYEILITGDAKQQVRRRIEQHVEKHPNKSNSDFKSIKKAIQFCDIEHLKKIILKEEYWKHFEVHFKDVKKVEKYFDQFSEIRHAIKHKRELTELVLLEGQASIEWLEMILKNI